VILMGKYRELLFSQTKRIGKDNLMLLLSVYPALLGIIGRYLVPWLRRVFIESFEYDIIVHYPAILVFFILANPYIYGALAAFTVLEEREEGVFHAIRVTPLTLQRYMGAKIFGLVVISIASGMFVTWVVNLISIGLWQSFVINTLLAFAAPFSMIAINCYSNNRVEGFALTKGSGILIMLPLLGFYIPEKFHFFVAIIPGYWPAMSINKVVNPSFGFMPYWSYAVAGFVYILVLIRIFHKRFERKLSESR